MGPSPWEEWSARSTAFQSHFCRCNSYDVSFPVWSRWTRGGRPGQPRLGSGSCRDSPVRVDTFSDRMCDIVLTSSSICRSRSCWSGPSATPGPTFLRIEHGWRADGHGEYRSQGVLTWTRAPENSKS